jgi:NTE family protein
MSGTFPPPDAIAAARRRRTGIGLALGSGGVRGLAHIVVLEILDELGVRPAIVAGTSMGAVLGAAYCAGVSGAVLREHVLSLLANPLALAGHLAQSRTGVFTHRIDAQALLPRIWPPDIPQTFDALGTPFIAVSGDARRRTAATIGRGALLPAVAASMAIPGLVQPVELDGTLLIDGVTVEPVPVACLTERAGRVIAVEVNGGAPFDTLEANADTLTLAAAGLSLMEHTLTRERLRRTPPDLLLQPPVGHVNPLDILQAREVFAAADGVKEEMRRRIAELLTCATE